MFNIRRSEERGHLDHGWLDARHTFSFGRYVDRNFMGFRTLRVMNEDRVAPGAGFGTHPHDNMEIITYVLEGALAHRDSMGSGSVIRAGDLQRMTAGTGVEHSEFNHSKDEPVHLYQIWIFPERKGLTPGYEELRHSGDEPGGVFRIVASRDGREGSLTIHQDAAIQLADLRADDRVSHHFGPGRYGWLQVLTGEVTLNGHSLDEGDGVAISDEAALELAARSDATVMLFDLA